MPLWPETPNPLRCSGQPRRSGVVLLGLRRAAGSAAELKRYASQMAQTASPYKRVHLACEQLDVAIEIFFSERSFVSALTLAGAAEEILGVEYRNRGGEHALAKRHAERERLYRRVEQNRRFYPNVKLKSQSFSQFKDKQNAARDAAKHIANKDDSKRPYNPFFPGEPRVASVDMILRALQNQELLGLQRSELGHRFYGWHMSVIHSEEPDAS